MTWRDYRILLQTPSFVLDTLGMTAMSFGMGALAFWMPDYLEAPARVADLFGIEPRTVFGIITALAGLGGTLAGGLLGDWLRTRLPGSYFLVSGVGLLLSAAVRGAVPGHAVSLGLVPDLCRRLLHVHQHRADERDPGQRGPPRDAARRLRHEHPGDPRAGRRDLAADHRGGVGLLEPLGGFAVVSAFLAVGGLFWLWGGRYLERDTRNGAATAGVAVLLWSNGTNVCHCLLEECPSQKWC